MTLTRSDNVTISHYRILKKLGARGRGEVHLTDKRLGRKVALRRLTDELTKTKIASITFLRRSRASAKKSAIHNCISAHLTNYAAH